MKNRFLVLISILILAVIFCLITIILGTTRITTEEQAAKFLNKRGLLQGDDRGNLMLEQPLTREQMVVVISRLLGVEYEVKNFPIDNITFLDVPKNHWAAPYIAWAQENKITEGYNPQKFGLGDPLTVWQTKAFFIRTLGYNDIKDEEIEAKAEELGITKKAKNSDPTNIITRGEMALLMYNTLYAKCKDGQVLGEKIGIIGKKNSKALNKRGNSVGNIINDGYFAGQGEWIYYSNPLDNNKLYEVRIDGTNKTKMDDETSYYINVCGDWVYYSSESGLYKIKTDGTGKFKLSNDSALYVNVIEDWIYYAGSRFDENGKGIYKIRTNGTEKTKLCGDGAEYVNVVGDWIYYTNTDTAQNEYFNLYKIRTDGTQKTKLSNDFCRNLNVVGDWIYYSNLNSDDKGLYKIRTDGTQKAKISDKDCKNINVAGDWIYYVSTADGLLYRMKQEGTENMQLTKEKPLWINIVKDWIYYFDKVKLYKIKTDGTCKIKIQH